MSGHAALGHRHRGGGLGAQGEGDTRQAAYEKQRGELKLPPEARAAQARTLDGDGGAGDVAIVLDGRSKSVALAPCATPEAGGASGAPVAGSSLASH